MIFKVYLMRHHGERRLWKEMMLGPFYIGTIITFTRSTRQRSFLVASLLTSSGGHYAEVREIYEPTLIGFSPNAFELRGFERIDHPQGVYGAVQEWHVEQPTQNELLNHGKEERAPGVPARQPAT